MPRGVRAGYNLQLALDHIHALGVASREQIGGGQADNLLRQGFIRCAWIDSYALTKAGEKARKEGQG